MTTTVTVAEQEGAAYVLVVVGDRSERHALEHGATTIGRAEDCGLRIDDASVSRNHARLELDDGGATLHDLGSHNGTRVNDVRIHEPRRVGSGDVITVGEATLILYLGRRPARRSPLATDIVERLESEVDRALRYRDMLAVVAWDAKAPPGGLGGLLASVLRRCDAAGIAPDGTLLGIFPGLDAAEATEVARRATSLLRAVSPHTRAGVAVLPSDAVDPSMLLLAARDALASAVEDVGLPDQAARRMSLADDTAIVVDPGMLRVYELLRRLATSDLPVLVTGETGVGKELAAHALHAWSPRAKGPLVVVNCAALPENLVESELFGHKRGAFSGADRDKVGFFESANGGTLFLDEIGELSLTAQAKLLRAVETRTITPVGRTDRIAVDLRIVAATNRDLAAEADAGRFRSDLYYRLSAAVVALPPLRDRPREVPVLVRAFVARACERLGRAALRISDAAMRALMERPYPGNVRELANVVEYAVAVCEDDAIEPWHLPAQPGARDAERDETVRFRPVAEEIEELEARRMREALEACDGNQSRAADLIGMPRRTFVTKLGKYRLRGI